MMVVHLLVDTRDAMGANLVNTMCEGVASFIESITGGKVFLRILSNLADRSLVRASVKIPAENLANNGYDGEQVRDGIIIASQFAAVDPYRAATHNKGIMNGIDAVALATGNDWRAVEAGAHAYAARGTHYTSLSRWTKAEDGSLAGEIELPIRVGIVGGPLQSNPSVAMNLRLSKVESSRELAEVMAAVGLAQNFSALRALVTDGIQRGHMTLHARSVATAAGATPEIFDSVVEKLVESGEIKIWKAEEVISQVKTEMGHSMTRDERADMAAGHGKIILFGEHAVVYGSRAIAAPVPLAVRARIVDEDDGVWLVDSALGSRAAAAFGPGQTDVLRGPGSPDAPRTRSHRPFDEDRGLFGDPTGHGARRFGRGGGGHHPGTRPSLRSRSLRRPGQRPRLPVRVRRPWYAVGHRQHRCDLWPTAGLSQGRSAGDSLPSSCRNPSPLSSE